MTNGLDQSVMQKHLTCKDLWSSQKNISTLAGIIMMVNFLFLFLGCALQLYSSQAGIALPELTDNIYPTIAIDHLGLAAGTLFLVGIAAAAYSSADSSLTGLTTSFCIDILGYGVEDDNRMRQRQLIHLMFTLLIFVLIMGFNMINNQSVLYYFIRTSGFIYGPLLSLYLFGIYSNRTIKDKYVPVICILSPLASFILDQNSADWLGGYEFGYDILLVNSLISYAAFYTLSQKQVHEN
jgi:Na+/proline symporter